MKLMISYDIPTLHGVGPIGGTHISCAAFQIKRVSMIGKMKAIYKHLMGKRDLTSKITLIKPLVEELLIMNIDELYENKEKLSACLKLINEVIIEVGVHANDYPENPINGEVWFSGATVGGYAEAIAKYLDGKKLLKFQADATDLWVRAVLSVNSHYHHIVGPAMIANAKIQEELGNHDYPAGAYNCIIQDFEIVLDEAEHGEINIGENALIALESLRYAAKRLLVLNETEGIKVSAPEIINRVEVILKKSKCEGAKKV